MMNRNEEKYTFEIFDSTGNKILEGNLDSQINYIDASKQLSNGVYFVHVRTTDTIVSKQKIIVAK